MRTSDVDLCSAVKDISQGNLSPRTEQFITSLPDELNHVADVDKVVLFAERSDAWAHNMFALSRHPGSTRVYTSEDHGDSAQLDRHTQALQV